MRYVETEISDGILRGGVRGKVEYYLGVPYAAPPLGTLRWTPPQPVEPWQGLRDAVAFGPSCAQWHELGGFSKASGSEDCLYLNIYVPLRESDGSHKDGSCLPVMVWIPGGGFFSGSGDEYDPAYLVERGVVFVSINYRVGVLGFFSHPAINVEGHSSGNYGIMDQQAALRWVRENIACFGGDPENVTIFGESAGAISVTIQMISPTATGLFNKAIIHSSLGVTETPTLKQMEPIGIEFATKAGCTDQSSQELRALSVEEILATNSPPSIVPTGILVPHFGRFNFPPMIDGETILLSVVTAFEQGAIADIPVITGTNSDEMTFFVALMEIDSGEAVTAFNYELAVTNVFGDATSEILRRYPVENHASASNALAAAMGDSGFIAPVRRSVRLATSHERTVYAYDFEVRNAPSYLPSVSFPYLSYHTGELAFIFKGFRGASGSSTTLTEQQQQLSETMVTYWTNFARSGSPNVGKFSGPAWVQYDMEKDNYLLLKGPKPEMIENFAMRYNCCFWDRTPERGLG